MSAINHPSTSENLVRQEWTSPTTVDAWDRWSEEQAVHCQPLTDALIEGARLAPGLAVLDLACGVGQPSFSIAGQVGTEGSVRATDLSKGMLEVAEKNAAKANITNVEFQVADAHDLPFADNSFDRVVSRLGLMYFWDIETALREIRRVLKPGGVGSFVVWGANATNPFFSTILSPFMKRKEMPLPPADAPTPSRFGDVRGLASLFEQAGFTDVVADECSEPLPWPGTPEALYRHFYDMAAPLQPYLDSFSDEDQADAIGEVVKGFEPVWDGTHTRARASFNRVTVVK